MGDEKAQPTYYGKMQKSSWKNSEELRYLEKNKARSYDRRSRKYYGGWGGGVETRALRSMAGGRAGGDRRGVAKRRALRQTGNATRGALGERCGGRSKAVLMEEKGGGERGGRIERTVPGVGTEGEYAVKVEVRSSQKHRGATQRQRQEENWGRSMRNRTVVPGTEASREGGGGRARGREQAAETRHWVRASGVA